ncbi:sulfurtransferase TusA family protein [Wukongibacter sp. M2B1]|uniref:sulfurtransferase TusA family protein n=1 Tax=Wukongibacter sp. M2B1 TaxID=3088895 RepID=UPI003D7AE087
MKTLDCLGDICPIPIVKIKKELQTMKSQESIKVVTDHSCVANSILDHYKNKKVSIQTEEVINGVWEIIITKC